MIWCGVLKATNIGTKYHRFNNTIVDLEANNSIPMAVVGRKDGSCFLMLQLIVVFVLRVQFNIIFIWLYYYLIRFTFDGPLWFKILCGKILQVALRSSCSCRNALNDERIFGRPLLWTNTNIFLDTCNTVELRMEIGATGIVPYFNKLHGKTTTNLYVSYRCLEPYK